MLMPTDILRAALCCVADEKEERTYLQGVYITPTHIFATDGRAAVRMEHGADTDIDAVFLFKGDIPASAEGTLIHIYNDGWMAIHVDEYDQAVGSCELTKVECRYPDFEKLLPASPEPVKEFPMFTARLLALPQMMFTSGFGPVKFKPYGKDAPCQMILDPVTNHLYGNPFLVIMPLHANAFELCQEVLDAH
ncbi:hypothetical protein [Buttiauxella noackiae]|uniref:hypothetical protein n=1 Tax=Buttiauxella noackiae TaxID=82992 RepID=UPI0028D90CF1|nr:hypothetical protein [Buttiauxella noackiae]